MTVRIMRLGKYVIKEVVETPSLELLKVNKIKKIYSRKESSTDSPGPGG